MHTFPSSSRFGFWPASDANGLLRSPLIVSKPFVGLPLGCGRLTLVKTRRKRRKKGKFSVDRQDFADEKHGMPFFACSQFKDERGFPPLHHFTSRWISAQSIFPFLRLSLVVKKLQLQPVNLSRIAVCWCHSKVRTGSRAVISATRNFLYERSILVLKGVAFVGSVLLMGMLSLYVQGKLQTHLENHVLPPVASIMGAYLGRSVSFGKVQSVSPLGITLESCYIGPHDDEFSCGQLPFVEIRVRPFTSIRRGQLVLDAVLIEPNVLVCQKRDWSWLGISTSNGRSSLRSSADEGIDMRTRSRRSSREQVASRIARERDDAARRSANSGYVLPGEELKQEIMRTSHVVDTNERNIIPYESFVEASSKYNVQRKAGDLEKTFSEVPRMEDEHRNSLEEIPVNAMIGLNRSLLNCKSWFETHFVKPVPLFKRWNGKAVTDRFENQRRNLDLSAAAARVYFDILNQDDGLDHLDRNSEISSGLVNKFDTEGNTTHSSRSVFHESDDISMVVENLYGSLNNAGDQVNLENENPNGKAGPEGTVLSSQINNIILKNKLIQTNGHDGTKRNKVDIYDEGLDGVETIAKSIWCIRPEQNKLFDIIPKRGHYLTGSQSYNDVQKDTTENISSELLPHMITKESSRSGFAEKIPQAKKWWKKIVSSGDVNKHKNESSVNFNKAEEIADPAVAQAKSNIGASSMQNWMPATIDSIYIRGGTLMLLAYGDVEPRIMESVNGYVKLRNKYEQIDVHVIGRLRQWRVNAINGNGGRLLVKVFADLPQHKWHVKLKGNNLYAPLLERLLEVPLDWADGRASGELSIWASKGDVFPNLAGRLNVSKLAFRIWETPSAFKDVCGTLFIQGQRLFLHNTTGYFGAIPLHVSGDMDLNPDGGEYRLVCQVPNVEANSLMKTLKARPPLFSLAGAVKAAVYCRGPLEAPVFAGSAEISKKDVETALDQPSSNATEAIRKHEHKGAIAAFDRIPFSYASANFTFDTDNCVADVYGIRVTLVDGGELRGAGNLWICPEGDMDPSAVNMDLSGQMFFDSVVQNYLPENFQSTPVKLEYVHGEAKIHGSLMQPIFDIKWNAPDAKGSFSGVRGDINISHEAIAISSSAFTFDLSAKIHTAYPPRDRKFSDLQPSRPKIEGLDFDLRMRGFDFLGLISPNLPGIPLSVTSEGIHTKLTGRAKFQGRVVTDEGSTNIPKNESKKIDVKSEEISGVLGEILLSGLKLNQFLVAPHLSGNMEVFPTRFKLNAVGRADEHLMIGFNEYGNPDVSDHKATIADMSKKEILFSLERGQLQMKMDYQPGHFAKLEVRNLQLDELEVASLRGSVQKVEAQLNFQKRKGQGVLSVRRPRFSGVQGESLDLSFRWSGDVITLERSVLEQASSRYELQGEYVLPGPRDRVFADEIDGNMKTAMAGQFGSFITSLGRWRLQLEVPGAEVTDLLPVARLLSRSSDPAVVSRSKELFMQGMRMAGFYTENIKQQIENAQNRKISLPSLEEGTGESIPLPGLAELKGHWHGTFDASGGGNGDTSADFDFHGEEWEWGTYKIQRVVSSGNYNNNEGLHLDKIFIQKDAATLHADGTLLGPKSNLHFAVLNLPVGLVPPLLHAIQSSTRQTVPYETARTPITSVRGILYMEGDLRGPLVKPQCDVQVRLLDGVVGGVELGRAEVVASVTSSNRFNFNAKFEPSGRNGHVYVRGSLPVEARSLDAVEDDAEQKETRNMKRSRSWTRNKSKSSDENDADEKKLVWDRLGDEGWEVHFAESLKELDWDLSEKGAVQMDVVVKDGGMMLITALSPHLHWLQGNADLTLQVRGTAEQPTVDGVASFHRVSVSSPVLPRPVSNVGGTIRVINNQLRVEGLEGRVGRKGRLHVKGKLPLRVNEASIRDNIELKTDFLEVRAKNIFSGQVDTQMRFTGSLLEPEVSGIIKLSHGEAYLPQEKGLNTAASTLASSLTGMASGGKLTGFPRNDATSLPDQLWEPQTANGNEDKAEEIREQRKSLVAVGLRNLRLVLGPELRVVYPLILNFAVTGEIELNGLADPQWIKPKGTLTFENGDVNLVATQVRLNRDHPNRAKFEPEQGLDPTLDLALVGADWQLKVQGRARNWQDNLVITSTRSGEPDAFTRTEAARVFESQLADSLLEGNGQLAFKKLAAATVETLMPKIEGKGEFGQARWRLVSAPQIPNLLSLDPTTDPFKSLANLSFGTEVEVQLGKRLQASVVRQLKESEMATQWTLIYHLSNKLRILFSSIPSVDNRLLFEYSATSQN